MPDIDAAEAVAHDPLDSRSLREQNPIGYAKWLRDSGPQPTTGCRRYGCHEGIHGYCNRCGRDMDA